jgi:hypothetical protein
MIYTLDRELQFKIITLQRRTYVYSAQPFQNACPGIFSAMNNPSSDVKTKFMRLVHSLALLTGSINGVAVDWTKRKATITANRTD